MKKAILFAVLLLGNLVLAAQQTSMDALKADYPQLMKKFGKELEGQRADYIFAIDVSGTMNKYRETVVPALGEFFKSLQEGDYVSIIKFGGEATNEVGSAGKVSPETVTNLINYAGHVYDKPTTAYEKEKYYHWTDLDNMLHYLADDMKQIDRSRLKFVFIITDFLHDPSPARRGHEDWAGVARRFATEQEGNDVYVFCLQLPGSGRDLEKVRNVFPKRFNFNHVPITSGSALSDWFTQRKNAIMLDKFYALIAHKITPAELAVSPSLDIDGNLKLGVSWHANPVYDKLRVDTVSTAATGFTFRSRLPKSTTEEEATLTAGKLRYHDIHILKPRFKRAKSDIVVTAGFEEPYAAELAKLGFEAPRMQACGTVSRAVFCYPLPFWLFCLIIALIILYIVLVIRAFSRNASDFYRIGGKFEVQNAGLAMTEKKKAGNVDKVDFGKGASFLPVPDASWALQIEVKRYNPFFRPLKHPEYVVSLTKGSAFKIGAKYGPHQHPSIPRYTHITVGDYRVRWMQ